MIALTDGWEVASTSPGTHASSADLDALDWRPARVPGTAAAAIGPDGRDFDAQDWWFRTRFALGPEALEGELELQLDGIATVSEVYVNHTLVLKSESMWRAHAVDITSLATEHNELVIVCRALVVELAKRRRPGPRWRTRVANSSNLRWYRTMIYGRSPGFAPGPAPVGPWRPVRLNRPGALSEAQFRARIEGSDGVVSFRGVAGGALEGSELVLGSERCALSEDPAGRLSAELRLSGPERWWPHTHGVPVLHEASVERDGERLARARVGFRTLGWPTDIPRDGLDLGVNGVPVFLRGAVWTPADLISMAPSQSDLRAILERVRDAGMNMLRVVGAGAYESDAFYELCDELGILVWQDLMFANLDYPVGDPGFRQEVEREAEEMLSRVAGRPSLAVVCGNSEVEQQPAMLGLDPELGRSDLWERLLPELVDSSGADCAYVASTPCGGDLPFHPHHGVTHYFGVSGYFGSIEEARRAEVRFASECLAFANVPDEVDVPVHHPAWKQGVIRDAGSGWDIGAGWDFDDVRDHYLRLLFEVDPVALRRFDHARYLELSRAVSGEVMAAVMGEWRREHSPCRGALVLWCKDMLPGAGLGVLDHRGAPKVCYHHLRRALAPTAVWMTDEGVAGIAIHVANDGPLPFAGRLRVALYHQSETCVAEASQPLALTGAGTASLTVEGVLRRFVDAAWAYRFGPPGHDLVVASLESDADPSRPCSQAVSFPAGRPRRVESEQSLGISTVARPLVDGRIELSVSSRRLAYGVRLSTPGFTADDDAFCVEPGHQRVITLQPLDERADIGAAELYALNLDGAKPITLAAQ
ncbi:MAG: glycoside hydrolase family 2 protein [Actinomycetota bacterium]|nr:glycoside hydrolase family 2 protein [Actinomycetota bacterium]